ncbi:PP2C family protein-serine/threonine phosphatase [Paractinoplanes atraurantiacus]|uniref:Stage II sporulation protein E (SpoIIE) n=1 Tax=Paractinoplanes atraurantiacus TaxID=1036182 RepID=A0A285KM32_9ACTN|nr:PP2C family protein-serine/threonine phosphatase [Actinoplanes atraurantiacus]SNY73675.1 Stage II sporulation protein E (SpoIIE) [Actinoplanes atraurantiacus]
MTAHSPVTTGDELVATPAPALLRAALDAASEAVLLCGTVDDKILLVNTAAATLVPGLAPGGHAASGPLPGLARAVASGDDDFTDEYAGRHLHGRRRALGDDHYGWYLRDRTDEVVRADALQAERARTAFLAEAGRRLSASLHQGRCLRITAELAVAHLADAAIIVLPVNRRHSQWVRLVAGGTVQEGRLRENVLPGVPGLVEVLGGFPPIPSKWLDAAQAPEWLLPDGFGPIGALLVTPLPGNAEPAGALILARRGALAQFSTEDEMLARIFAARAGAAISAAGLYREQVDTTAVLQADLLPPELPQPDGIELVGSYQAAKDALRIGGDFYDVFGPTEKSADTVIALGDVCGKGPEAAVLTGKVRQTLRALRLVEAAPGDMLRVLNQALLQSTRQHRFVTMVVGSVSRADHGRVHLTLATGGHPPPLVLRTDGTVEEVPTSGTLIGAVARTVVRPADVELAPGELCLLYSDGLTEARGGASGTEEYGEARLRDALSECRGMPGAATVERIRQLVSDWVHGGARDDIAMLAVRAPDRTQLSLRTGARNASPFAIDAPRRGDRRVRQRT